jgi:uncharacterized membrane protein
LIICHWVVIEFCRHLAIPDVPEEGSAIRQDAVVGLGVNAVCVLTSASPRVPYGIAWHCSGAGYGGDAMAMDLHDTLMGSVLVISGGLTFAYTRAASRILLILTLIGAAATIVIGVLLFFHLA